VYFYNEIEKFVMVAMKFLDIVHLLSLLTRGTVGDSGSGGPTVQLSSHSECLKRLGTTLEILS